MKVWVFAARWWLALGLVTLLLGCGMGLRSRLPGAAPAAPPASAPVAARNDPPRLSVDPNPVHVVTGGTGSAAVEWDTGRDETGQVYVTTNDGPEQLFAEGSSGVKTADWIQAGATYTFRLYAGQARDELLQTTMVEGTASESP